MKRFHLPLAAALTVAAASASGFRMEILDEPWHLAGFENPLDLSALAAATPTQLLVGSDEMYHVQPGVIDAAAYRIESRRPVALPVPTPDDKTEVDIEGIAWSPTTSAYYVTGSHGVGKKKGDLQPDRLSIFRIPADSSNGTLQLDAMQRASLQPWIRQTALLRPFLHQPLQHNGLNIEGLTAREGQLFIGLRAPNLDGDGLVLELPADAAFTQKATALTVHRVPLGAGRGIREIVAVEGGFILVSGNASAPPSKKIPESAISLPDTRFDLLFWDGRDSTTTLGTLPENGGKAEGLLVLEDTPEHIKILVIFDSLLAGEPLALLVHR
ncbi:hypothetical protein HNR46_002362 [Haloferula luteola]|uniref:DUF3616 domain-containing protein n=1 Tax=Haloferula luteola TaxID=595692 RepID=A0A840VH78_9BACT|nr:DUF3616 domain-containing protein [Haloferula luteola]MBB5352121.1 hypothetical protein [Haloferula luteola]